MAYPSRPNTRGGTKGYDQMSSASGAYVGKRASGRVQRGMSAQSKTIKLNPNSRTFYPDGYYKRVGYQKSEASSNARVDALGQRVRDRFNEDVNQDVDKPRSSVGGLHHRTLKQLKSQHNKNGGPASQASRASDVFTQNKRKSMVANSQASVRKDMKMEDQTSVITADRLRKFNDIQGTIAGTATEEIAAKEAINEFVQGDLEVAQGEEGCGQGADDAADELAALEEEKDEVLS